VSKGKVFVARESRLTEMFRTEEFVTIYNIFLSILIVLSLQTLYTDIAYKGTVDFSLIFWVFGEVGVTGVAWTTMLVQSLAVYPVFNFWAARKNANNYFWAFLYAVYQLAFLIWPGYVIFAYHLPPASALIISCENVRSFLVRDFH
jgi:sterol O-acyltransferase